MRRCGALVVLAIIAGCGTQPEPSLLAMASDPQPPPVPELWRTITSETGDVTLVVPPDLVVTEASGSITGFRDPVPGAAVLTVTAIGPAGLAQPSGGESVMEWMTASGWLTGHEAGAEPGEVRRREVALPAGPALELTAQYRVDRGPAWTVVYVIDTGGGYGLLQVGGDGTPPDEAPEEMRLMRELVEFSP